MNELIIFFLGGSLILNILLLLFLRKSMDKQVSSETLIEKVGEIVDKFGIVEKEFSTTAALLLDLGSHVAGIGGDVNEERELVRTIFQELRLRAAPGESPNEVAMRFFRADDSVIKLKRICAKFSNEKDVVVVIERILEEYKQLKKLYEPGTINRAIMADLTGEGK